MSTTFELRTSKKVGYATVQVRVQSSILGVNIRQSTKLKVPISKWKLSRDSRSFKHFLQTKEGAYIFETLSVIERSINSILASGKTISASQVKSIVNNALYGKIIHYQEIDKTHEKTCDNLPLKDYYKNVIIEMENGIRHTNKGTKYSKGSINAFKQTLNQLIYYQESIGYELGFDDIDMSFYHNYTKYLEDKQYTLNSIGKCISALKTILHYAECDGVNKNTKYKDKRFKARSIDIDSVYLTQNELNRIVNLDLSIYNNKLYEYVRDIFIVGVWTAQRVSDYNNISPNFIKHKKVNYLQNGNITTKEYDVIELTQQKTKTKVSIPISSQLLEILKKYNYKLPRVRDITINKYIKKIAKLAGIDELVNISKIVGGNYTKRSIPKYELIYTHTARRTGATLMYLAGMDIYDIMKITGHSSPTMLKKYIKADSLDIAGKIVSQYNYFQ